MNEFDLLEEYLQEEEYTTTSGYPEISSSKDIGNSERVVVVVGRE